MTIMFCTACNTRLFKQNTLLQVCPEKRAPHEPSCIKRFPVTLIVLFAAQTWCPPPMQPPTIGGSPYGMLPEAPKASPLPEHKVGLTQQRLGGALLGGTSRPMALISPR